MGTREDASGDLLDQLLVAEGFEVVRKVVPDERDAIAEAIEELAAEYGSCSRPAAPASARVT